MVPASAAVLSKRTRKRQQRPDAAAAAAVAEVLVLVVRLSVVAVTQDDWWGTLHRRRLVKLVHTGSTSDVSRALCHHALRVLPLLRLVLAGGGRRVDLPDVPAVLLAIQLHQPFVVQSLVCFELDGC